MCRYVIDSTRKLFEKNSDVDPFFEIFKTWIEMGWHIILRSFDPTKYQAKNEIKRK